MGRRKEEPFRMTDEMSGEKRNPTTLNGYVNNVPGTDGSMKSGDSMKKGERPSEFASIDKPERVRNEKKSSAATKDIYTPEGHLLKLTSISSDVVFKRIFGTEVNKDILIAFLNGLFDGDRTIEDVTFINTEIVPENVKGKRCVVDLVCRDSKGQHYLIEMQNGEQAHFRERILFYAARIIGRSVKQGSDIGRTGIKGIYTVGLLNFRMGRNYPDLKTVAQITYGEHNRVMYRNFKIILIQLPMAREKKLSDCATDDEKWITLLAKLSDLSMTQKEADRLFRSTKAEYRRLLEEVNYSALSDEEQLCYDMECNRYEAWLDTMQTKYNRGRAAGRAEAREEIALMKSALAGKEVELALREAELAQNADVIARMREERDEKEAELAQNADVIEKIKKKQAEEEVRRDKMIEDSIRKLSELLPADKVAQCLGLTLEKVESIILK